MRLMGSPRQALLVGTVVICFIAVAGNPVGADGLFTVHKETNVCRDMSTHGVGLMSGSGTLTVPAGPGPVVAAYLEWVGTDDSTPDLITTRPGADSTLIINGVDVVGTQAAGATGAAELQPDEWWFSWSANVGPGGYDLMNDGAATTLAISGWDEDHIGHHQNRNGALLTVIYDTSPCDDPVDIELLAGVDYFYSGYGSPTSSTIIAPVNVSEHASIANVIVSHWGTDDRIGLCRTMSLWSRSGTGAEPDPASLPLIAPVDNGNGEASSANFGVEIIENPFFNPRATCTQTLNPVPDAPYEAGHPYPGGAAGTPYRLLSVSPEDGGFLGSQVSLLELELLVPPNSTWLAFQLESEGFNIGESGAWGGGFRILSRPAAAIGDRLWIDSNKNGLQDDNENGLPGVEVRLLDSQDQSVVSTTTTGDDGYYIFAGIPGCFLVEFDLPDGYAFTSGGVGNDPEIDSNVNTVTPTFGRTDEVCVELQDEDYTIDAGLTPPELTGLGDYVWLDENKNGLQDEGEPGVPGVLTQLAGPDGEIIAETTTDKNGRYAFRDLIPDLYRVIFQVPDEYEPTNIAVGGADDRDSDASVELVSAKPPKPKGHDDDDDDDDDDDHHHRRRGGDLRSAALVRPGAVASSSHTASIGTRWIQTLPGTFHPNLDAGLITLQAPPTTTTTTAPPTTVTTVTTATNPSSTTTTAPSSTVASTTTTIASTTTTTQPKPLAFTGGTTGPVVLLGSALLGLGSSAQVLRRRMLGG